MIEPTYVCLQTKIQIKEESKDTTFKRKMMSENSFCIDTSKYIDNQTCLICDSEFESTSETTKHIEDKHLDIVLKPAKNSKEIVESHKDIKKNDKTKNTSLPKKKTEKPSKNESRPNSISKPTISSGLKLKINLKDKKVKKEHYCHICKLNFPSSHPIKYYNHYRLKHRDIVEVSVYCFSIYIFQVQKKTYFERI